MRQIRLGLWLMAIGLWILVGATFLYADEVRDQKDWVKGGMYIGRSSSGGCITRPFVKVGEADNDVDTDEPQILGFEPGNIHLDRKGEIIYEHVKERLFARVDRPFPKSVCKCPPYY